MAKPKKRSWIVNVKATVIKEVICCGCTQEEAEKDPFAFSVDERELECLKYSITSIEPND